MAEFIGLEIEGVEKIYLALAELPSELTDAGADAILDYWRGALRNPANYPPYRYISRAQAYPSAPYKPGYFSARQFRFVMALVRNHSPGPQNRTGELAKSWDKIGRGESGFLVNSAPYASFVIGDGTQAAQPALVGWLTGSQAINSPRLVAGAERALKKAADEAVRKAVGK